jgi:O-acetylhomoserine/O-acetylserine sulfhydrylase-like pyridoxal-dependent enzyme
VAVVDVMDVSMQVSVGIENIADIVADFEEALKVV